MQKNWLKLSSKAENSDKPRQRSNKNSQRAKIVIVKAGKMKRSKLKKQRPRKNNLFESQTQRQQQKSQQRNKRRKASQWLQTNNWTKYLLVVWTIKSTQSLMIKTSLKVLPNQTKEAREEKTKKVRKVRQ